MLGNSLVEDLRANAGLKSLGINKAEANKLGASYKRHSMLLEGKLFEEEEAFWTQTIRSVQQNLSINGQKKC